MREISEKAATDKGPSGTPSERDLISETDVAPVGTKAVCVRFAPDEYAELAAVAARTNQSVPSLLRSAWAYLAAAEAAAIHMQGAS